MTRLLLVPAALLLALAAPPARAQDPRESLAACQQSCSQSCFELARTLELQLSQFRQSCGSAARIQGTPVESSSSAACIRTVRETVSGQPETVARLCTDARPGTAECIRAASENVSSQPDTVARLCRNANTASAACIRAAREHVSGQPETVVRLCASPRADAAECIRATKENVSGQPETIIRLCGGHGG
jgi:hypothetical protein